ncbi:MAG TPA: tripartite tricarboxylate transporter substrate binding protein [Burkholderiales bacterium]|jgi:tripartite-type tricarboxylate transporter receptor subunit TctC|nr:tripartite tricarboxylate transporter substrate binding protein [Burkholderiales bacterium]
MRIFFAAAWLIAALPAIAADAQSYPSKPIRIIVPFPPGGISDVMSRVFGQKFTDAWNQPVIVENRAGAGGNIGTEIVAKSPPDGYTLVMGSIGTHAVNVSLFSKLPYDPVRDFAPVALVIEADGLLVLHPSVPVKTVKDLIALARARPGQLVYASAGNGTAAHLAGELFKSMAKIDLVHIPYKGNVPAISDLVGGQTSMLFATLPTVLPLAKAGKLHALAVTGAQRNATVPDVPTMADTLPGFEVTNWIALFAPAGTPGDIVAKLNAEIMRIMRLPDVQSRLVNEGAKFTPNTPSEFAAFVKAEITKWGKVIKDSGARVD